MVPLPPELTLLFVVVVGAVLGIVGVAAKPVSVGVALPGAGAAPLLLVIVDPPLLLLLVVDPPLLLLLVEDPPLLLLLVMPPERAPNVSVTTPDIPLPVHLHIWGLQETGLHYSIGHSHRHNRVLATIRQEEGSSLPPVVGGLWKGPTPLLFVMVPASSTASIAWLPKGKPCQGAAPLQGAVSALSGWQGTATQTRSPMYMLHAAIHISFLVIHLLTSSIVVVVIVVDIVVVVIVYYRCWWRRNRSRHNLSLVNIQKQRHVGQQAPRPNLRCHLHHLHSTAALNHLIEVT